MLQGRLFSYGDAQRYRLGVNHHLIPVNAPRCPVHSYHRDGADAGGRQPRQHPGLRAQQLRRVVSSNLLLPSRRWRSRERPITGTIARTTTITTRSPAFSSA